MIVGVCPMGKVRMPSDRWLWAVATICSVAMTHLLFRTSIVYSLISTCKAADVDWVIEVAHKEMKCRLNLGECQSIDFAGQIAGLSSCVIQYNILSYVKQFESYETMEGLFTELTGETVELSVVQRMWGLIVEVINVIAEFVSCDPFELIQNVINNNNQIKAVKEAFDRLEIAGNAA